jgi:hypothetical protein
MAKVTELAKPEVAVAGVVVGHIIARIVDAKLGWNRPFRRVSDWAHVGILLGSAYFVATDRAPEMSSAVFFANSGIVASILGDQAYERWAPSITTRRPRIGETAAVEEAKRLLLAAGRENPAARQRVGVGSYMEF